MKRAIAISLIIIFFSSLMLIPSIWFIIGIIISITGFIILLKIPNNRIPNKVKSEIERLKLEGHKVYVEFDKCEVLTNNYHKEIPRSENYKAQAFDTLFDKENAVKNISIYQSRITYKDSINGITYISPIIAKERVTIMFKLELQKGTYIYIDRQNPENYYFDIEFFYE